MGGADPRHQARDRRRHPAGGGAPPRTRHRRVGAERPSPSTASEISPIADAVAELLACFPVYRSYLPLGLEHLRRGGAVGQASTARSWRRRSTRVVAVLADPEHPASVRFQQTSGMVMAKGVEDTAFYRYSRLGSLTEVGADPSEFSHRRRRVPPPAAAAPGELPDVADDAVDARHQARRGRPGPHRRARRDPRTSGSGTLTALREVGPARRRPARAAALGGDHRRVAGVAANGCTRTPRRRHARRATRPVGPTRPRTSSVGMHALVDSCVRRRPRVSG